MQIAIDAGGTFTDCLARLDEGRLLHLKIASTPHDPALAFLEGVARLVALAGGEALSRVIHGSTVATNALLEGKGGSAALVVDRGYEDLLLLARQQRPALYDLEPQPLPPPIPRERVFGLAGRTNADGSSADEGPLDCAPLITQLKGVSDLDAVGLCFLHAHTYPARELAVAAVFRDALPGVAITCSHELSPIPGEFERTVTTALNARLLNPVGGYLRRIAEALATDYPEAALDIVLSNGDALPVHEAMHLPVRMLLSGPAGGVMLGQTFSQRLGRTILTLDIGGTSTDCAAVPFEPRRSDGGVIGGYPIRLPMVDLETVGAGGGSLIWLDAAGALQVGPESAGADPGPACYGRGNRPTLTDAHAVLGHLPATEKLGGFIAPDLARARESLRAMADSLAMNIEELAAGAVAIANQRIATAVRAISATRGIDPTQCALAAMGGAGGLHAVAVARLLGIPEVIVPPLPGLASAQGLARCGLTVRRSLPLHDRWPLGPAFVESYLALLVECQEAWRTLERPEVPVMETTIWCRYAGQDTTLPLIIATADAIDERFHAAHREAYGFALEAAPIEVARIAIALRAPGAVWTAPPPEGIAGGVREGVISREALGPGSVVAGPSLIVEDNATCLIPEGASLQVDEAGCLRITPGIAASGTPAHHAIAITLANDLLSSVAEEMALALEQSAHSSNIKDRRDLSTAIFDAQGRVLAQGAHIPVHLGSMQTAVEGVLAALTLEAGDTAIVNSPYHGGTHLPDLTLVTCVDLGPEAGLGYVASRAHHADIGGAVPGSMPLSARLEDEGILIPPTLLARAESFEAKVWDRICAASRQPEERRGDLAAQLGANLRGARRLHALIAAHQSGWFQEMGPALIAYADQLVQEALRGLVLGEGVAEVALTGDGLGSGPIPIRVRASLSAEGERRRLVLDFVGTSPAVPGPFNCPRAVTTAATAFVLRCLAPEGTPTNAGLLECVDLRIPEGSVLDAPYPSPTAAGNVETSQKVVAALLMALRALAPERIPAPSQGTMNNLLIGGTDPRTQHPFTYYETLAGGCGAGPHGPGANGLHSHMTNSRNTPIEVLEARFPLTIDEYAIRRGSGGQPKSPAGFPGGDGITRVYRFQSAVTLTLLADWPASDVPGAPKPGRAYLTLPEADPVLLPDKWSGEIPAGAALAILTPGGWAWDPI